MEMSKADQIQIGMLGVIIVLMILQMSGILGDGDDLAAAAKNDLVGNTGTIATTGQNQPVNTVTPGATAQPFNPTNSTTAQPVSTPATQPQTPTVDPNQPTTVMSFDKTSYDFGTIPEGEKVKHTFKFKNTGKEELIISNAKGSCGCTVPKWPREPIAPGASSEITVEFNSDKKSGKRDQQVTITANTNPPTTIVRLTGEVTPKGAAPNPGK